MSLFSIENIFSKSHVPFKFNKGRGPRNAYFRLFIIIIIIISTLVSVFALIPSCSDVLGNPSLIVARNSRKKKTRFYAPGYVRRKIYYHGQMSFPRRISRHVLFKPVFLDLFKITRKTFFLFFFFLKIENYWPQDCWSMAEILDQYSSFKQGLNRKTPYQNLNLTWHLKIKDEIIITRVGHKHPTPYFLITKEPTPTCDTCKVNRSIDHIVTTLPRNSKNLHQLYLIPTSYQRT